MTALSAAPAARVRTPLREDSAAPTLPEGTTTFPFARTKLVERLMSLPEASVAVLVAPAGYGKSALLAEWAARDTRQFASLRLAAGDDDPSQLRRTIAQALETVPELQPVFRGPEASSGKRAAKALAGRLTAAMADAETPLVLVVDDVHVLRGRESHAALADLIENIGPNVRIALASREQIPLPLARLRAEQRLLELRTADLVLTRGEIEEFAAATGLTLDERGVDLLAARTEGWPAAVSLAVLATRDERTPQRALAAFGGDDRTVAAYVREEMLSGLPARVVEFLTRSAVLKRLSGAVCDHVLERDDSAQLLTQLSRKNLLIVPLDRSDREYRYHPLFAEVLQGELERHEPGRARILQARASAWYAAHDQSDLAIEHAIAAGDIARAGHLLWRQAPALVGYGRGGGLAQLLASFSTEQIVASAPLSMAAATGHLALGDRALVEHWIAAASRARIEPAEDDDSLDDAMRVMRALVGDGDVATMRADAASVHATADDDSPWRAFACLAEGVAAHLTGDRAEARLRLEEGARRGAALAPAVQVLCLSQLALLAIDDGEWDAARALALRARTQSERESVDDYPISALVFCVCAA